VSTPLRLHQLDTQRLPSAMALLERIHPVDEAQLADVFAREGAFFDAFWNREARERAAEILIGDRQAARVMLERALLALAGRASWTFPRGIAFAVHAVVGVDPSRLQPLYALSGGPPRARLADDEAARLLEGRVEMALDIEPPARFAPEPGEPGLTGAFSPEALSALLALAETASSRADLDARLDARAAPWHAGLSGEKARCASLRRGLDEAWPEWTRLLEALRATAGAGACLGVERLA
jgi:hypothetical protein